MARVVAFVPDLLFGSNVQGALRAGGHEVELVGNLDRPPACDVVVVDLTDDGPARATAAGALRLAGTLGDAKLLGFFAHVEPEVRAAALAAGFDLVVPRSRMNREGAALVDGLAAG